MRARPVLQQLPIRDELDISPETFLANQHV